MKSNKLSSLLVSILITFLVSCFFTLSAKAGEPQPIAPDGSVNLLQPPAATNNVLALPSSSNFDFVLQATADAINTVNVLQSNGSVDPSDLSEDFDNFSRSKYLDVLSGSRSYQYLQFQEYWAKEGDTQTSIRAVVRVPQSEDNSSEAAYLDAILNVLSANSHISTDMVTTQQKDQIVKDIAEIKRLTCIKSLRLIWAIFGDDANSDKGLFPQVYKANVVQAGDLTSFVDGGVNLFSETNMHVIQSTKIKHANVSNEFPELRPEIFDNKVVAFFRPQSPTMIDGHIGVGKLYADQDSVTG